MEGLHASDLAQLHAALGEKGAKTVELCGLENDDTLPTLIVELTGKDDPGKKRFYFGA